jgi:hypothetical protein
MAALRYSCTISRAMPTTATRARQKRPVMRAPRKMRARMALGAISSAYITATSPEVT